MLVGAAAEDGRLAVVLTGAAAAMFPDADALFFLWHGSSGANELAYIEGHRGITHSFLLAPVWAIALALFAGIFFRRAGFRRLYLAALAGIVSHILFDWMTSFGTMFFSPVSWRRFALDWVFIIDPFFTGIPVVALAAAFLLRRTPKAARRACAASSVLLALYIGFCGVEHSRAIAASRAIAEESSDELAALPQPLSPFRWMLIAEGPRRISRAFVDIGPFARSLPRPPPPASLGVLLRTLPAYYPPSAEAAIGRFPRGTGEPAWETAARFDDVARWLRFSRYSAAEIRLDSSGRSHVKLTDLRFTGPWGRTAFVYEAVVSPDGREEASGFVRRLLIDRDRER